jgi:asparagine synthase (glutamine-hydrolysing)
MRGLEMVQKLGLRWVLWRTWYAFRLRSGLLKRRFPPVDPKRVRLSDLVSTGTPTDPHQYRAFRESSPALFFFPPGKRPLATLIDVAGPEGKRRTVSVADDYCRGRFLYYSRHVHDLGRPPDWLLNPFSGGRHDVRRHWCDTPTFSPALGDIKDVWEPSRFACAFWLVRAYALTGDEKYPAAFWDLFESWCEQNPPNMGPNWKCGQETALRTMAWCFALFGFWNSPATRPDRVVDMVKMIAIQADRIAANIAYAVSQKNNHAISEAVGLVTTALLFPELRKAASWHAQGRRVLEQEVARQIYDDGSYVQHSMNYHRVMLHDCLWIIRLAELNGVPLSKSLTDRVARAGEFLFEMLDLTSGKVPNYGPNDGALVLPLAACDYTDYRPTVQAARFQATGRPALAAGPWDEMSAWLFGADALDGPRSPAVPTSRRFDAGGYYTLRAGKSWCMIRCHSYRDRPAHVDMLHLDLWRNGVNILGDSGTYKYYVPENPAMERALRDIQAHNTVEVDGTGPLTLVSRFLWLPWPKARCLEHHDESWQGEHYAYDRSPWHIVHRRRVELPAEGGCRVHDEVLGAGTHKVVLRWQLADGDCRLDESGRRAELNLPDGLVVLKFEGPPDMALSFRRGENEGGEARGWMSEYYAVAVARPTLEISVICQLPARFDTRVSWNPVDPSPAGTPGA